MSDQPPLIAIVNHDATFIRLMERLLQTEGFRTLPCGVSEGAFDRIAASQPDLIMLDTWLETRNAGWGILQQLWLDEQTAHIPVIIASSDRERATDLEGTSVEVVYKPFKPEVLLDRIRDILGSAA